MIANQSSNQNPRGNRGGGSQSGSRRRGRGSKGRRPYGSGQQSPQQHKRQDSQQGGPKRSQSRRPGSRNQGNRFSRRPTKPAGPRYRKDLEEEVKLPAPVAKDKLRIVNLGGLEEVGEKNMQFLEYGDDILIIDCGLWFAEQDVMPGVDYIVPNSKYLQANASRIKGMIFCHGHLDHVGGIPHIAPLINYPTIYSTPLTKLFIERRQEEFGNKDRFKFTTFEPGDVLQIGVFRVEPFHINHNIPEAVGLAIHTPVGTIVHTGDFKFDLSPTMGPPADVGHLAKIGDAGVTLMMTDSTSAGREGHQISETDVLENLDSIVKDAPGRIVAATFSSLLMRVQMLITLAERYGRKVVIEGRSMKTNIDLARERKLLKIRPGTLIDAKRVGDLPDNKVMVIGTGAQAEEFAMLNRIANGEHAKIKIKPGDMVLFSSSVIPGHERNVDALRDTLERQGAEVIHYEMMDVHAGGHGKNEDLKLMMRLVRPKYILPIHANYSRRLKHAKIASKTGIPLANSVLPENGDMVELDAKGNVSISQDRVPAGNVLVDGLGEGDVNQVVLRDRKELAAEGLLLLILTLDDHGKLSREPDVVSRGFVSLDDSPELGKDIVIKIKELLGSANDNVEMNADYVRNKVRNDLGEFLWNKTERRPMILPVIVRA